MSTSSEPPRVPVPSSSFAESEYKRLSLLMRIALDKQRFAQKEYETAWNNKINASYWSVEHDDALIRASFFFEKACLHYDNLFAQRATLWAGTFIHPTIIQTTFPLFCDVPYPFISGRFTIAFNANGKRCEPFSQNTDPSSNIHFSMTDDMDISNFTFEDFGKILEKKRESNVSQSTHVPQTAHVVQGPPIPSNHVEPNIETEVKKSSIEFKYYFNPNKSKNNTNNNTTNNTTNNINNTTNNINNTKKAQQNSPVNQTFENESSQQDASAAKKLSKKEKFLQMKKNVQNMEPFNPDSEQNQERIEAVFTIMEEIAKEKDIARPLKSLVGIWLKEKHPLIFETKEIRYQVFNYLISKKRLGCAFNTELKDSEIWMI